MLTLLSFVGFTALVGLTTWFLTRGRDTGTSDGYFLAGRSLTGGLIAGSLMLTNLSTEQLVGLNGAAFTDGLSVMAWEVVASLALVLMALWFLPRFLRSGIATVPEFLGNRFGQGASTFSSAIFVAAYALLLLPLILFTGARGLAGMLDVQGLLGLESETAALWVTVWLVGCLGSLYAIFGGLRSVAVSDTINAVGLLVGGFMILGFGLLAIASTGEGGGVLEGWRMLHELSPEKFNSVGTADQSVPFETLFTGVLLLNLFYWCTNQQIIQRTLGASSLAEGQRGVLIAGFLKLLGPLILVLPGLIAYDLFSRGVLDIPRNAAGELDTGFAYGNLVKHVLPSPLTGFFAAVMVGAILSSFNSALNSTATLFSLGIYKPLLARNADATQVVRSGKLFSIAIAIFAMGAAPGLANVGAIFGYLQTMNAIYFIPLFAVVLTGLVNKSASGKAANTTLGLSLLAMILGLMVFKESRAGLIHEFHFMGVVFVSSVLLLVVLGRVWPRAVAYEQPDVGAVNLLPWRYAKPVGAVLVVCVLALYSAFADFGGS